MFPDPVALSIHESGHAVMGVAVGLANNLRRISIRKEAGRHGHCEWTKLPEENTSIAAAIAFAGPIAQCIYAPDSIGENPRAFGATIFHPPAELNKRGLAGWYGARGDDGDLRFYARRAAWANNRVFLRLLPSTSLEQIESRTRILLKRPSVGKATCELARALRKCEELVGADAENFIQRHLAPDDFVARDYFDRPS